MIALRIFSYRLVFFVHWPIEQKTICQNGKYIAFGNSNKIAIILIIKKPTLRTIQMSSSEDYSNEYDKLYLHLCN